MPEVSITIDGEPVELVPTGLVAVLRVRARGADVARAMARDLLDRGVDLVVFLAPEETIEMLDEEMMRRHGWARGLRTVPGRPPAHPEDMDLP
jgi:hypothetical protein